MHYTSTLLVRETNQFYL